MRWTTPPPRLAAAVVAAALAVPAASGAADPPATDYPIRPVPFTAVAIEDGFWSPRLETNRRVTVRHDFAKCETTGRIRNFAVAGGLETGAFEGLFGFNDSDVYKVIEGASYSLRLRPDPELDGYLDGVIAKIAAAQEDDGYLYTAGSIPTLAQPPTCCVSRPRWSDIGSGHELYDLGHLYEAAAAHYQATGKRTLLDVALKSALLLTREFRPAAGSTPRGTRRSSSASSSSTGRRGRGATSTRRGSSWSRGATPRATSCTGPTARTTSRCGSSGRRSGTRCGPATCTRRWPTWGPSPGRRGT
jgi:hypothetical protein